MASLFDKLESEAFRKGIKHVHEKLEYGLQRKQKNLDR